MRHPISVSSPGPPPAPASWSSDFRPSGGDTLLTRSVDTLAWLAKVHAEHVQGKRAWDDLFDVTRLGNLLDFAGVDLEAAQKADADAAYDVPAHLADVGTCAADLAGASFLKRSPGAVCMAIRRRYQAARVRGR
jgi:hypothetical protein